MFNKNIMKQNPSYLQEEENKNDSVLIFTKDPDPKLFLDFLTNKSKAQSDFLKTVCDDFQIHQKTVFKGNQNTNKLVSDHTFNRICGSIYDLSDFDGTLKSYPNIFKTESIKKIKQFIKMNKNWITKKTTTPSEKMDAIGYFEKVYSNCFSYAAKRSFALLKHLLFQRDPTFKKNNNLVCSEELTKNIENCCSDVALPHFESEISRYYFKFKGLYFPKDRAYVEDVFVEIVKNKEFKKKETLTLTILHFIRDHRVYLNSEIAVYHIASKSNMSDLEEFYDLTEENENETNSAIKELTLIRMVMYTILRQKKDAEVLYELLLSKKENPTSSSQNKEFQRGISGEDNNEYTLLKMPTGRLGDFVDHIEDIPKIHVKPTEGYRWKKNPVTGIKEKVLVPIKSYERNAINRKRKEA